MGWNYAKLFRFSNNRWSKKRYTKLLFKIWQKSTYEHTLDVINELLNIEKQFGYIESGSEIACYCHD